MLDLFCNLKIRLVTNHERTIKMAAQERIISISRSSVSFTLCCQGLLPEDFRYCPQCGNPNQFYKGTMKEREPNNQKRFIGINRGFTANPHTPGVDIVCIIQRSNGRFCSECGQKKPAKLHLPSKEV